MVKTKILLVEDDKSLREIYGVRLYSEGYDIISAGDGEEALALAIKERPLLIISDVMMPKISGFDMLDILRSTSETRDTKVIMMTALSSEDQRARGEALGADRYLVKSQVGIEDVVRTVHEVLGDAPVSGAAPLPATPAAMPAPAPVPTPMPAAPAMPAPAAPQQPAPAPIPQPVAIPAPSAPPVLVQPQQPVPSVFTTPPAQGANPLPQPTAPFSTNRPASLGDRVIHPLEPTQPPQDFSTLINAELGTAETPTQAPTPAAPQPVAMPQPAPMPAGPPSGAVDYPSAPASPALPQQQPQAPAPTGMSFEETPYAPNPTTPPTPGDTPPLSVPPRQ